MNLRTHRRQLLFGVFVTFLLGAFAWYALIRANNVSQLPPDAVCIDNFDSFAFTFPDLDGPVQEAILPSSPWSPVDVPAPIAENLAEAETMVLWPDPMGDQLWFTANQIGAGDAISLFNSANGTWRVVTNAAGDHEPPITFVHYSKQLDTMVGIGLDPGEDDSGHTHLVRFSYDRAEEQFVVDSAIPLSPDLGDALAEVWLTLAEHRKSFLVFDENDVLWLFLETDGIYRLDFTVRRVERPRSLEEIGSIHTVLHAEEGRFFFSSFGATVLYNADSGALRVIESPYGGGGPTGAFVDSGGTLWSGDALWVLPPEGDSQTFHPRSRSYWWHQVFLDGWRYYSPPDPFMETSDGRIWFQINRSSNWKVLRSGIAWFEPATEEGCWFTSETGPLREDSTGNLWLLLDGILYASSRP